MPQPRKAVPLTIAALIWAGAVIIARAVHVAAKKPSGPAAPARWLTGALAVGSHFASFWAAHAARLALCLLFFAGVHACGRWALEGILEADRDAETEALRPLFSIALGLGLVGYLAFFMAAAGLSGRGWADAGFAMVSGLGAWNLRRFGKRPRIASFSWLLERRGILERGALLFLAAGLAYSFLGTTVPEVFYDALVYHLAVPQAYLASGRMVDLPYNHYSYLPLFVSMLYYWALAAGGMYAAKIFAFFLGLCLLAALVAGGRFFKDWGSGLVAAALFLGAPLVLLLFWECNSDGGAAFYLALSILSFAQWRRRGADARRWLYLSGLMGGLALASKYTTAIGVACLAFAAFVATSRAGLRRRLGTLMLYAALMMAPLLPWWVRNGVYAGNPFYPYLAGVLGGPNAESALLEGWRADARGGSPGFHPSAMAAKIWRDAMRGFEHPSYYDTGPAFVAFLPWTAWAVQETWGPFLAVYAASAYGLGLCATYVTRFLTPYLIPVCWLLAVGIVAAAATRAVALCLGTLLAASLFANLYQLSKVTLGTSGRGLAVAEGLMTPETYLSKQRNLYPQPSYGAWSYLRKYGLPKEGAILLIGDSRAFYSPAPTIAGAPYDPPPAFAWARASRDPEELWRKLREEGVSVVVSNGAELQRDYPAAYRDDRRSIAMISRTLKDHFKLVYQDRYAVVYLLRNPASSS